MTNFAFAVLLKGVDQLSDPLGRVGGKFGELGAKAMKLGKTLTASVTLPLVGGFALAAREVMQAQDAQRLYGLATGKSADEVRRIVAELEKLPRLADDDEQMAALTAYEQAGIAVGDSMLRSVGAAQELAFALGGDVGGAARATGAVLKAWNLDASHAVAVTDALAEAAFKAGIPIETMSDALAAAAPLAIATGQSLSQTAAQLITFERLGLDGAAAQKRALLELQEPADKAREIFTRLGLAKNDFVNADGTLKDLAGSMKLLRDRGANAADFATIFGKKIGPGLERFAREGASGMRTLADEIERGGQAQAAAQANAGTFSGQLKLLGTAWSGFLGKLGDAAVVGPLGGLISGATKLAEWLNTLSPTTLAWVGGLAAAAAAIGPVLIGIGTAVKLFGVMKIGLGALGLVVKGVFGPWGIALSALFAIGSLIYDNWDSIADVLKKAGKAVWDFVAPAFEWIGDKILWIWEKTAGIRDAILDFVGLGDSDESASTTQASAAATSRAMAGRTLQRFDAQAFAKSAAPAGQITVKFDNAPAGMRTSIEQSDGVDLNTKQGLSMAGAY